MNKFLTLIAFCFLAQNAFAQGDLSATLKGQSQTPKLLVGSLQVPNSQATKLSATSALIETGNTNLLADPSFEGDIATTPWTGPTSSSTSTPIHGLQHASRNYSSAQVNIYQDSTINAAGFFNKGQQGLASIFVRTNSDANNVYVCQRQAGVLIASSNGTSITNCVKVVNDGNWGLYKLPVILGATSNGIAVVSLNATTAAAQNMSGYINVDHAFLGLTDLKQDFPVHVLAGESYFAGTSGCSITRSSATVAAFAAVAACPGPTIIDGSMGTWATTDADALRQTITNLPAGKYKATFRGLAISSTGSGVLAINDGTTTCEPEFANNNSAGSWHSSISCTFTYTSSGTRVFELYGGTVGAGSLVISNGVLSPRASPKFQLEYYGANQVYTTQYVNPVMTATMSAGQTTVGAAETIKFNTIEEDTRAGFNTGTYAYTVPEDGSYHVSFLIVFANSTDARASIYKNGAGIGEFLSTHPESISGGAPSRSVSTTLKLVKGDIISGVVAATGKTINQGRFSMFRIPGNTTIVGSFNEVMTTQGVTKPVFYSFKVAQGTITTVCSASPCTVYNNAGNLTTGVTRSSAGVYVATLDATKFSYLNCGAALNNGSSGSDRGCSIDTYNGTGTSLTIACANNAAGADQHFVVNCHGSAP